ncbi:integrase catalytic subunit [Streptococcus dysgalactiae subsp. equisimilis]|nr:integrase catalytic subunit [Streptococcus dysgalactiae subsp. equisimilis]
MERIPVQFKGCDDYYNENVGYPLSRINLEHYLTEGGVLYFVVYSKDVSPTVTYASLTPKVIKNVLPASDKKKRRYLAPVLDGYNSEIIDFTLSRSPNLIQVKTMLEKVFPEETYPNTILHSDQGWQYQHEVYHRFLASKGIHPSMSRKGTSTDNGMMESFFGVLKKEMFYGFEKTFKSLDQLEQAITEYFFYYNNKCIKEKLKGLSPVQYRIKSFQ